MSVRFLNNNSSNNADVVSKTFPLNASFPWVRNPSWPACEANSGDNRVRGLYAVWPSGANFIAMTVAGAYTVNYGDGTTTNYTSGTQANYEYDYNDADLVGTEAPVTFTDAGDLVTRTAHGYTNNMRVRFFNITTTTGIVNAQFYFVINATANTFQVSATEGGSAIALTNNGTGQLLPYRVATVTITPQGGSNLTSVNLFVKHNQSGLVSGYSAGWLDIAIAASTITTLTIGANSTTILLNYIEQVKINQLGSITTFASLFEGLRALQNVVIASTITTVTSTNRMFSGCSDLQVAPSFTTSSVTNMGNMFSDCLALQTIQLLNTSSVTDMSNMFSGCVALQTIPLLNTVSVTTMSGMFNVCRNLQTIPLLNTASVTGMASMFGNCDSLKEIPLLNTASVTGMTSMFSGCTALQTIPLLNTVAVTNMAGMFSSCTSLLTIPLLNTAAVTDMNNMFNGCVSLQTIPLLNTAVNTSLRGTFQTCRSLQTIPLLNTSLTVEFFRTFENCTSLTSVPALVTTAVAISGNFGNTFAGCASLSRIEAKDFRFTFSVASCKLSATALNEIYTNLPTVTAQTITVSGNYGVAGDDPTIATAKGWTVTG